jgi:hypothetical protein
VLTGVIVRDAEIGSELGTFVDVRRTLLSR